MELTGKQYDRKGESPQNLKKNFRVGGEKLGTVGLPETHTF